MTTANLAEEVQALERLDLKDLRTEWRRRWGEPPKLRSRELLAFSATDRLQTEAFGGLSSPTRRRMAELARRFGADKSYRPVPGPKLTPGCSLVREWGGARHVVQVIEDGFGYQGQRFSSLSKVAQYITGSKRSGMLFFGLKEKTRSPS
jgi:hypothetical protein